MITKIKINQKINTTKQVILIVISMLIIFNLHSAAPGLASGNTAQVSTAAMKMVGFISDPAAILDMKAAAALVDYVLAKKPSSQSALPKISTHMERTMSLILESVFPASCSMPTADRFRRC